MHHAVSLEKHSSEFPPLGLIWWELDKRRLSTADLVYREIEDLRSEHAPGSRESPISPAKVHGIKIVERLVSLSRPVLQGHLQDHALVDSFVECRVCTIGRLSDRTDVGTARRYATNPVMVPKTRFAYSLRLEAQPRGKKIKKRSC